MGQVQIQDIRQFGLLSAMETDPVTGRLRANSSLRSNTVLRKDEWKELDEMLVEVARQRLNVVNDIRAAGLVHTLQGLGTTISEYEKVSFMDDSEVTMDLEAQTDEDRQTFTLISIPVPIFQKNFRLGLRTQEASQRIGQSLDLTQGAVAMRLIMESMERTTFLGETSISVNGTSVAGLTTESNVNTSSLSNFATVGNIFTGFNTMVNALEADNMFGPYNFYAAKTAFGNMRQPISVDNNQSALQRVLAFIPTIQSVKPGDVLASGSVVGVQMTRDVIDLAVAADAQTVSWNPTPFTTMFKVFASLAPRPKSDVDNQSGIVHGTGADG